MAAPASVNQLDPTMTAPWTEPAPLADVPGGEIHLLHRSAWSDPANPLRCQFKPWYDSPLPVPTPPEPPFTETVNIFLDDNENNIIATRTWTHPIAVDDYFIEISADKLPQGEHAISFIFINYVGVAARSFPYAVAIDKEAPLLSVPSELIFPPAMLPPRQLTADYLDNNDDKVEARLPVYTTGKPWDRITWYWGKTPGNTDEGGVIELDDKNYAQPVVITLTGEFIRGKGDGRWFVGYAVQDRAGNKSVRSDSVELDVAATPIPRVLPPVKVKEATNGATGGGLSPGNAINGVTVIIVPEAVIHDRDDTHVQWGAPGSAGEFRTNTPVAPGSREYKIPASKIAQHTGKSMPVTYEVFEPGVAQPHTSQLYTLRVEDLTGLPTVQCEKVSGGNLSLASVTDFAKFTLEDWSFISPDQFMTVKVRGVDSSNQTLEIALLSEAPVPAVTPVIAAGQISKADLQRFKLNLQIEVRVSVSFDDKLSWKSFPLLTPRLIA